MGHLWDIVLALLRVGKDIFDDFKGSEQEALKSAGYSEEMTYQPEEEINRLRRRRRKRRLIGKGG